jgi:SAM-dependent methyltransferase
MSTVTAREAAIACWTAVPCGLVEGEPGTREYVEQLLRSRAEYAPWMDDELAYEACRGLDVLDVGSGQGIDVIRFARAGARVTGIDLTPRHVELARAHLAALELDGTVVEADATALPFPDGSFDAVSSNGVLHHVPEIDDALREIRRVLRPGGTLRIAVYNRNSFHYWLGQFLWEGMRRGRLLRGASMADVLSETVERGGATTRPLVRVYSPRQVRGLLQGAGFTGVRTSVHQFDVDDVPILHPLRRFWPSALSTALGRVAGWYVVASGRKPADG